VIDSDAPPPPGRRVLALAVDHVPDPGRDLVDPQAHHVAIEPQAVRDALALQRGVRGPSTLDDRHASP
jgi:hypothetical protein